MIRHETPLITPKQFVNIDRFHEALEGCEEIDSDQFLEGIKDYFEDSPEQNS